MNKILLCFQFLCIINLNSHAQDSLNNVKKNGVYVEFGGNSDQYSINYERTIVSNNLKFAERIGFGYGLFYTGIFLWNLPIESSVLIGKHGNYFETGLGFTFFDESPAFNRDTTQFTKFSFSNIRTALFFRVGYRHEFLKGNWFFRIGYTPFLTLTKWANQYKFVHYLGVSFGKSF